MTAALQRILVIKLGALGDFLQALGPFAAIRNHHRDAHVTLLTTAPYREMAEACGYFDDIRLDSRPKFLNPGGWLRLRRGLRGGKFDRVYDLQTSDRSGFYFYLFFPGPFPEWSGIVRGASHPHANPKRDFLHTRDRQAEQLRMAGIPEVPRPALDWMRADISRFPLSKPYALLVPGGAPHRPRKRWPEARYAELANRLLAQGIQPLLLGTAAEAATLGTIAKACAGAVNLGGKTSLFEIAELARGACAAIGNDTGPMHLIAQAGAPTVVLFSGASDPALCAPTGTRVAILKREPLDGLATAEVEAALHALGAAA